MNRRSFLQCGAAAAGALVGSRSARAATAVIEVLPDEPIGIINPNVYGQFVEHIGGVVYDGIWVGPDSDISNIDGVRRGLVDLLAPLKPPVIRWPGGCFADSYDWRDGIGPAKQRRSRANFWINDLSKAPDGPQKYDPNEFGTHEFVHFCRDVNAQPYFAANLRSLPPERFSEWIEYCNSASPLSSAAQERSRNGDAEPFQVGYWGVGNESWGCGGYFAPGDYAAEFRRYTAFLPQFEGKRLRLIASGPNGGFEEPNLDWTHRFFESMARVGKAELRKIYGWSLHYYCSSGSQKARGFPSDEWYDLLHRAAHVEKLINAHWSAMAEFDPAHSVKLIVDEWGSWHAQDTTVPAQFLFGYAPTIRDALLTGIFLDVFQRHADKVAMTNVAQLVNNLNALFLAHENRLLKTPVYHVFSMYGAHAGNTSVRVVFQLPAARSQRVEDQRSTGVSTQREMLSGSASVRGSLLVLTVVNSHLEDDINAGIDVRGRNLIEATATTLTANKMDAGNTFDAPDTVAPTVSRIKIPKDFNYRFPRASVTKLEISLA